MKIGGGPTGVFIQQGSDAGFGSDVEAWLTIEPGMEMTSVGRGSTMTTAVSVFKGGGLGVELVRRLRGVSSRNSTCLN